MQTFATKLKLMSALALTTMLLGACATPSVVNNDGCAWTKQIDAVANNESIYQIFSNNPKTLRPLTDQINAHNKARFQKCG